jgi:hypothetical protein
MKNPVERLKGKRILYDLVVRVNGEGKKVFVFKGKEYETLKAEKLAESDEVLVLRRHAFDPGVSEEGLGNPDNCRSCQALIYWREHPSTGKPHPFNPDGTSHFGSCPDRHKWRGQKRGGS